MMALLQRVSQASVVVDEKTLGSIQQGLLVFLCVEQGDTQAMVEKMLSKILKLRIFSDDAGKMNRSILNLDGKEQQGELLVISQFTLAAQVWDGNRPSFTQAADAQTGQQLYKHFIDLAGQTLRHVAQGEFGADMKVHLVNDGPVTIPIKIEQTQ